MRISDGCVFLGGVILLLGVGCLAPQPVDVGPKEAIMPAIQFTMSAKAAGDPRLEPLAYLKRYGKQATPTYAFDAQTPGQWKRWHGSFRQALAETIGLNAIKPIGTDRDGRPTLRVTPGPATPCNGYTRYAFTIETAPGLFVPAFLLVPDGLDAPRPAILCSHGHGYGMNALVGLTEEGTPRQYKQGYQHDFAVQAVKAGFVALAFDQMGFGRRRDFGFNKKFKIGSACDQPSKTALHWGMSMAAIRVWDAMRMIDFLQSRPEVLPAKIGMVGISGGGMVTQFTAALDDRVQAACVSGYCNRYADCILGLRHCIDNYVYGLGPLADNDDVACLIAPRPLLIEAGLKDPIFPIKATRAAIKKLGRCYKLLDAQDHLETDLFEGPHEFSGAKTWTFFAEHLGLGQ